MAADANFGCCSSYRECSDIEKCIKPDVMNNCNYWQRNLSNGINFYKDKVKKLDGFLYLIIDGRAFRMAYTNSKGFSYSMNENEIKGLQEQLKGMRINVDTSSVGYNCEITGTYEDPAYFRVNFKIGEKTYNIKNYNSYTITESEAKRIVALLPAGYIPEVVGWTSNGSFRIREDKRPEIKPRPEEKKIIELKARKVQEINGRKYQQLSFF